LHAWDSRWNSTTLKILFVPGGVLLAGVAIVVHSGWLTLTLPALAFLCNSALLGGLLLAWRFHSSRIFFALFVLFLAREAIALSGAGPISRPEWISLEAVSVLVPMDLILIALMHERGFTVAAIAPIGLLLFVESMAVAVLSNTREQLRFLPSRPHHGAAAISLPDFALFAFAAAGIFLLGRFLFTLKLADSALFWSLVAFFLSLHFTASARIATVYSATAACVLVAAVIENSYLLAYHDELTTLPSRRAFNDALLRLQHPYSIAVVDIDHFKRFNDTYGHDTGDQVLRLVAAKLSVVAGGGQAYRCGGEEFAILFPGKSTTEVVPHLEQLRAAIKFSEFRMRSADRRQVSRGPDRRNQRTRSRTQKGHAIRRLTREGFTTGLSVTVSIGAATSTKERAIPDLILQAADKALYRAKANGRNRVEVTTSARSRTGAKAAGIA
jgi:diguanylate cyclase (GGDEF)-like protein